MSLAVVFIALVAIKIIVKVINATQHSNAAKVP